jgi:lipopolysaccharide exporter
MSNTQKAIKGGLWTTTATVATTLLQFAQVAVLARLLAPSAFGVVSICTLVTNFFGTFVNLGFANSIIYKQENNQKTLSTLYYLNLILGSLIFICIYFSAPLIVAFYHEPKLESVIRLSSLSFLIIYFGQIYHFLLQRDLRFRSIAGIDIIGAVVGFAVTVILAYKGYEELALIYGGLVLQGTRTILQLFFGHRLFKPTLYFNIREVKEHLQFGIFNLGEGVVGFVQENADNIVIGRMLGVQYLGYYTLALQLAVFPINKLNPIVLQVAYPIIARMKDNASALKNSYLKIIDFLTYINMPLLAGLFITVESVVPLVYGPGWEATFPLIRIFVFVSLIICIAFPIFTIAYSKGQPKLLFYLNLITLFIKVPLVYVFGKYWQVTGVAFAYLLTAIIYLIMNLYLVRYLIGSFMKQFLLNISKPLLFCLLMMVAIHFYKQFVGYTGLLHALVEVAIGGVLYAALTLAFKFSLSDLRTLRTSL